MGRLAGGRNKFNGVGFLGSLFYFSTVFLEFLFLLQDDGLVRESRAGRKRGGEGGLGEEVVRGGGRGRERVARGEGQVEGGVDVAVEGFGEVGGEGGYGRR